MKILKKTVFVDGEFINLPVEEPELITDPDGKWHNKDRVDIYLRDKQEIFGFGGAFTEAAAHNYALMSPEEKRKALELLFGDSGLCYRFCRVPMGSCDFSMDDYRYCSDRTLSDFSVEHDKKEIIPFIRDAVNYRHGDMFMFASPWSPPYFFKDNNSTLGGSLRDDCYEAYAAYFASFIEEYAKEGVTINAVTPQNEPGAHAWEGCVWTDEGLIRLMDCLDRAFKARGLDVKILCWDYNRGGMFGHVSKVYDSYAADRIWGAGFHWYNGVHTGELDVTHECYPDKVLVETEFCHGLGARMYGRYRTELIDVLSHHANAVVEWNLILDEVGGPYHHRDIGCNSPIYYNTQTGKVLPREVYKQMYMFSHYIRPGAHALFTSNAKRNILSLGVRNPDGHILVYIYNNDIADDNCTVYLNDNVRWKTAAPAGCMVMWEFDPE